MPGNQPRFSIIIPTYQRRDVVLQTLRALGDLRGPSFEVIVVVDGSSDGTAAAIHALQPACRPTVIEQPNRGAAAARNRGAAAARGEILLFLDDDMEADGAILVEHDRSLRAGAAAVLGHIPLHPQSPPGFLSRAVGQSVERRCARLSQPGAAITLFDLLTGQLSVRADVFTAVGGFDDRFTGDGTFGDEDLDFGYRLLRCGHQVVFNPRALSWQRYVVTIGAHIRQWHQLGHADVAFARKHPEQAAALFALHHANERITRALIRPLAAVPIVSGLCAWGGQALVRALARLRPHSSRLLPLFARVRGLYYWRGVHAAGGIPRPRPVRVLTYHAIRDLSDDERLGPYSVPPALLRRQLAVLRWLGFHFIGGREFEALVLHGAGVPRQSVLLTFDDGYDDLPDEVVPILRRFQAPAVVFAVSGYVGKSNVWDERTGARRLALASSDALGALAGAGMEIGAHSRTHVRLPRADPALLREEVEGSATDLAAMGLPRPRLFAYPYGEHSAAVRDAVAHAGLALAFSLEPGPASPASDRYRIPRTEVLRRDHALRFAWKVLRMR